MVCAFKKRQVSKQTNFNRKMWRHDDNIGLGKPLRRTHLTHTEEQGWLPNNSKLSSEGEERVLRGKEGKTVNKKGTYTKNLKKLQEYKYRCTRALERERDSKWRGQTQL